MNKKEFLQTLELSLVSFKEEERKDIIYDYEEHFRIGEENGKNQEELITELGDPEVIANQYRSSNQLEMQESVNNVKNEESPIIVSIIAALALILFNLIFIIGPYLGVAGAIFGLFAAAVGITIGGIGTIFGVILSPLLPNFINIPGGISALGILLLGIGMVALGLLFFIGMCYLGKYFYKATVKYIKWNIKIIKK